MADPDIIAIYEEAMKEIELNHQVGKNHQYLVEEAIMNIAALKALETKDADIETLGN